ncbi:MAG: 1-acyl-sn-glycerol-3-phosphate acyltransferase [Bacteroidales bacterium]|jgi:1-acyl-sn-glycerol-3-phosphate acyltransferase|nr:1-acyl-sn-glycerol-3-phosphate acyltransferase [Bacteroidales bacterium]
MSYEKWSFRYWILKQYIRFADWLIHKKIVITGKDKIPKNKPIIFAPNHQNALSDPMAVLLNTSLQPVWLARADIFKSKTISSILKFLKIIPVYRMRDGRENLTKNDQTFVDSINILKNSSALALFPEAAHSGKRQMLAHKKGIPRIIFMAEEATNYDLDIQIIPTGIYYSHYWKFNRTIMVNFGDPIPVKPYTEAYKENPNDATVQLRQKINDAILQHIINIESKKYYIDFENIREIYGRHFLNRQGKKLSYVNLFRSDQFLVSHLDKLETEKPHEIENIVSEVKNYVTILKKYKIRNWVIENRKNNFIKTTLTKLLLIFIGLPVFLYGFFLNAIPFFTIDRLIRKKVKDWTSWSSFFLVIGILLFPIAYILEFSALAWLIPNVWLSILFLLSMPFTGKLAFKWYILFRKITGMARLLFLRVFKKNEYKALIMQQKNLFNHLDDFISVQ